MAFYRLSSVRCDAPVEVSSGSHLSYLESLNRSVIVLLLAAEMVLVTYDRPVPSR